MPTLDKKLSNTFKNQEFSIFGPLKNASGHVNDPWIQPAFHLNFENFQE